MKTILTTLLFLVSVLGFAENALAQRVTLDADSETVIILRADGTADTLAISNQQPLILTLDDGEHRGRVRVLRHHPRSADRDRARVLRSRAWPPDSSRAHLTLRAVGTERVMIADQAPLFRSPSRLFHADLHEEIAESERTIQDLARERQQALSEGRDAQAARLEQFLRQALEEAFDLRQEARRRQVEEFRSQADRQTETIEERQQNRDEIIERRFNELTREGSRHLDW